MVYWFRLVLLTVTDVQRWRTSPTGPPGATESREEQLDQLGELQGLRSLPEHGVQILAGFL